ILFSLTFWWLFSTAKNDQIAHQPIQVRPSKTGQKWREIGWSAMTSLIFTAIALGVMVAFQTGHTQIYTDLYAHGLLWYPISIGVVLLIHETYYYWLHR